MNDNCFKKRFGRLSFLILLFSVCCGVMPFLYPQWSHLLAYQGNYGSSGGGDINGDGIIDLSDAILSLQITSGVYIEPPTAIHTIYADITGNRRIGLEEAIFILEKVSGIRE